MTTMLPPFVAAYSLQVTAIVAALWLLLRLLAARAAPLRLRAWQAVLAITILLPAGGFAPLVPAQSTTAGRTVLTSSIELWTDAIGSPWWRLPARSDSKTSSLA